MSDLVLFVELEIAAGQMEAFVKRALEHKKNVLANEPGCHGFELLRPRERENTVFLYEVYADQDAIDHHLNTPYMKQYLEDTGPMITNRVRTLCDLAEG